MGREARVARTEAKTVKEPRQEPHLWTSEDLVRALFKKVAPPDADITIDMPTPTNEHEPEVEFLRVSQAISQGDDVVD